MNTKLFFLSYMFLPFVFSSPGMTQEKLRIDDKTAVVVDSPWKLIDVETTASLRGLHVLSKTDVWASGSGGTIVNTIDGGKTWRVRVVEGAEKLDFRDIHAIDDGTIVAITSGTPARIYRSTSGGSSWKLCYENEDPDVFLNALSFWNDRQGIVTGDPIDGKLFLLETNDGGRSWNKFKQIPRTLPGEAGFAASGTNMITLGNRKVYIALGGAKENDSHKTSRIIVSDQGGVNWTATSAPIQRTPSAGIFSICFPTPKNGVVVGGDYRDPDSTTSNYAFTSDGGATWTTPKSPQPPSGFRSCVSTWIDGREIKLIAVGPNGTDLSTDLGKKWHRVSNEGFHAIGFTQDRKIGWGTGADGRIAKWLGIAKVKPVAKSKTEPSQRLETNKK